MTVLERIVKEARITRRQARELRHLRDYSTAYVFRRCADTYMKCARFVRDRDERKTSKELDAALLQIDEWRERINQLQGYIVDAGLPIPQPNYVSKREGLSKSQQKRIAAQKGDDADKRNHEEV